MDIQFDEINAVNAVPSGNEKMMFVYQSKKMKNIYERYGNQMMRPVRPQNIHYRCSSLLYRQM